MKIAVVFGLLAAPAAAAESLPDRWIPSESTDRMDGQKTIAVLNPAREVFYQPHRRPEELNKLANLHVMCSKGRTIVYVELRNQLMAGRGLRVTYRFDDEKPVQQSNWDTSEDSTAAGFWGGRRAVDFARKIEASKTLLIRTQHSVFGSMEASFETSNAAKYFEPIKAACKW